MADEKKTKGIVKTCMLCGRPSDQTICEPCSVKIQGEALEHKHDVEKKGKTDTGRT